MNSRGIYCIFLAIFIMRVAFSALPYDSENISWYPLNLGQTATLQFAFWRLELFLVELALIFIILSASVEPNEKSRHQNYRMAKIILWIQGWYILEYCLHYTSVWITWEQLGMAGNKRSGLSSHIITSIIFGVRGWHIIDKRE